MKRIILVSAIIVFTFVSLAGQQPVFVKGSKVFNAGLGVGTTVFSSTYNRMVIPPLSASLEIGVTDHVLEKGSVGVGPYLAFLSYKWQVLKLQGTVHEHSNRSEGQFSLSPG